MITISWREEPSQNITKRKTSLCSEVLKLSTFSDQFSNWGSCKAWIPLPVVLRMAGKEACPRTSRVHFLAKVVPWKITMTIIEYTKAHPIDLNLTIQYWSWLFVWSFGVWKSSTFFLFPSFERWKWMQNNIINTLVPLIMNQFFIALFTWIIFPLSTPKINFTFQWSLNN